MKNIEISSVAEFHETVAAQRTIAPIFRGEGKATYSLLPRIGRCYRYHTQCLSGCKGRPFSIADELSAFKDFQMRAIPYLQQRIENDWEWLALAQNHGLPTRLLDWTENPLVAAFFACYEKYGGDSVIYVLDRRKFEVPLKSDSPFKIEKTLIVQASHNSPRVTAQSGLFTVHPKPHEEFCSPYLQRWIVKQSCLLEIALMLEEYGIHHASLFPGLDGIAQYLQHRWLLYSSHTL